MWLLLKSPSRSWTLKKLRKKMKQTTKAKALILDTSLSKLKTYVLRKKWKYTGKKNSFKRRTSKHRVIRVRLNYSVLKIYIGLGEKRKE